MPPKSPAPGGVQSLARAFALLQLLAEHHDTGVALPDLAAMAGIDRTTAHRMARFLEAGAYIERESAGKRYHLGTAAMALGLRAMNRPPPNSALVSKMKALARLTGDAVFLIVRIGDHGHCLHTEEGSHRIKTFHMLTGTSRLLGQGTGSMALASGFGGGLALTCAPTERGPVSALRGTGRCALCARPGAVHAPFCLFRSGPIFMPGIRPRA